MSNKKYSGIIPQASAIELRDGKFPEVAGKFLDNAIKRIQPIHDVISLDEPYLIKGWIEPAKLHIIYGDTGSFKSFIVGDMGLAIARGVNWGDRKTTQAGVLYISAEGGAGFHKRMAGYCQHHGIRPPENFLIWSGGIDLSPMGRPLEQLAAAIEYAKNEYDIIIELIIIDTISQTLRGDENGQDMAIYIAMLNDLVSDTKIAITLIHHTGHNNKERMRGSSALTANVDNTMFVELKPLTPLVATITGNKAKDSAAASTLEIQLIKHSFGKDADGDEISTLVCGVPIPLANEISHPSLSPENKKTATLADSAYQAVVNAYQKKYENMTEAQRMADDDVVEYEKISHEFTLLGYDPKAQNLSKQLTKLKQSNRILHTVNHYRPLGYEIITPEHQNE